MLWIRIQNTAVVTIQKCEKRSNGAKKKKQQQPWLRLHIDTKIYKYNGI